MRRTVWVAEGVKAAHAIGHLQAGGRIDQGQRSRIFSVVESRGLVPHVRVASGQQRLVDAVQDGEGQVTGQAHEGLKRFHNFSEMKLGVIVQPRVLPDEMAGSLYVDLSDGAQYQATLQSRIRDLHDLKAPLPPLGRPPV